MIFRISLEQKLYLNGKMNLKSFLSTNNNKKKDKQQTKTQGLLGKNKNEYFPGPYMFPIKLNELLFFIFKAFLTACFKLKS